MVFPPRARQHRFAGLAHDQEVARRHVLGVVDLEYLHHVRRDCAPVALRVVEDADRTVKFRGPLHEERVAVPGNPGRAVVAPDAAEAVGNKRKIMLAGKHAARAEPREAEHAASPAVALRASRRLPAYADAAAVPEHAV